MGLIFLIVIYSYFHRDVAADSLDSVRPDLGTIDPLGLPYESYAAVLNQTLINRYGEAHGVDNQMLKDAGYVKEPDVPQHWWAPSGRQAYGPGLFYQPISFMDSFCNLSQIDYDAYGLLATKTTDPLDNIVVAENDYRTLKPLQITDPNGNRSAVAFDALLLVVGTAVMGKEDEQLGDLLEGLEPDLQATDLEAFLDNTRENAAALIGKATTRVVYDPGRYQQYRRTDQPVCAATLSRETHFHDPLPPEGLKILISFSFSDGFGREIQKKVQAEPDPVEEGGPEVNPRWVGSGWTIFNNKGKPVRQYEPFFTHTHNFEFDPRVGVSPILFYDPLERVVCTLHPNQTYEKTVFDAWQQETWDVNDTLYPEFGVTALAFIEGEQQWFDPSTDKDVGLFFSHLTTDDYLPTWFRQRTDPELALSQWPDETANTKTKERNRRKREAERIAARNALAHAATPSTAHLDVLGRSFFTVADNGLGDDGEREYIKTPVKLDIQGNDRIITDPMGIKAFRHDVDMLGRKIVIHSADAGRKAVLLSVDEKPLCSMDANSNRTSME
jgi:hypothetical protein